MMPQWLKMIMCLAIGWWLGCFVTGMMIRPEIHKAAFQQGIDRGWIETMEFAIMHGAAKWEEVDKNCTDQSRILVWSSQFANKEE